jgi:hypothetical protein
MQMFKLAQTETLSEAFESASPFPHLVLDDLVDRDQLRQAVAVIPQLTGKWRRHNGGKSCYNPALGTVEPLKTLFRELRSFPFVMWLEYVTGIAGLQTDRMWEGAGVHRTERGGSLGVHVDFNVLGKALHRRLNVFIYCNEDWDESWGGALGLYRKDEPEPVVSIAPEFGRFVMFEASEQSYHGHPAPLACPSDRARLSIAAYYYTDGTCTVPKHTTIYR